MLSSRVRPFELPQGPLCKTAGIRSLENTGNKNVPEVLSSAIARSPALSCAVSRHGLLGRVRNAREWQGQGPTLLLRQAYIMRLTVPVGTPAFKLAQVLRMFPSPNEATEMFPTGPRKSPQSFQNSVIGLNPEFYAA
jgi:hypothetical protein